MPVPTDRQKKIDTLIAMVDPKRVYIEGYSSLDIEYEWNLEDWEILFVVKSRDLANKIQKFYLDDVKFFNARLTEYPDGDCIVAVSLRD